MYVRIEKTSLTNAINKAQFANLSVSNVTVSNVTACLCEFQSLQIVL